MREIWEILKTFTLKEVLQGLAVGSMIIIMVFAMIVFSWMM